TGGGGSGSFFFAADFLGSGLGGSKSGISGRSASGSGAGSALIATFFDGSLGGSFTPVSGSLFENNESRSGRSKSSRFSCSPPGSVGSFPLVLAMTALRTQNK